MATSVRRRVLSGGAWAVGGKLVGGISVVATNALLARLLAPEDFGTYALLNSYVIVLAVLIQFGLHQSSVRLIAHSEARGDSSASGSYICVIGLYFLISLAITGVLHSLYIGQWFTTSMFKLPAGITPVHLVTLWLLLVAAQSLLAEIYRGFHDIKSATIVKGLGVPLLCVMVFLTYYLRDVLLELHSVILVVASATLLMVLIYLYRLSLRVKLRVSFDKAAHKEVLQIALPLWITSMTLVALTQADIWILGAFRDEEEVGIYSAAARLVVLIGMPMLVVNSVIAPLIAELHSQGKTNALEKLVRSTAAIAVVVSLPVGLLLILASEPVMTSIYGDFYSKGAVVLMILSIGQLLNVIAGSCGIVLMMTGGQLLIMKITLVSGTLAIAGSISVVKWGGGPAVAIVTAGALMLQNIMMVLAVRGRLGIWTLPATSMRLAETVRVATRRR